MNILTTTLILCLLGADPGATVFPLLKIGQGPRASAMGESFTGLSDDVTAVYWNPAGLGQLKGTHLALSHQEWFFGTRDEVGHAALPLGPGALGVGLIYTGEPGVRYWDPELQQFQEFNAWNAMMTAGYGFNLGDNYELGASLTGLYQDLLFESGMAGAIDVGGVGHFVDDALSVGAALRHIGVMSVGGNVERLPMEGALGGAYKLGDMFTFTLDAIFPMLDNNPNFRAGVEVKPIDMLALRLGYRTGPVDLSGLGYLNGLCAGVGFTLGNFGIDYAMVPYGELGLTHRIGLRTHIPPPTHGDHTVIALDAETRDRLVATMVVTGVVDTTATTDRLELTRVLPGKGMVNASAAEYESATATFTIVAGRHGTDTVLLRPLRSNIIGGIYDAKTGDPIGGTLEYSGPLSGRLAVAAAPGTYEINDVPKGVYFMEAFGPTDEYLPQQCTLEVPPGVTVERDFNLWKKGDLLYLLVNFETAKADILPEYYPEIDRAARIIKQTPQIKKIELSGHTDPRVIATKEFPSNWELSDARAAAIKQYMVEKFDIDPNRIVTKGYADTKPVASNKTAAGMALNRRTELKILE